MLDRREFDVLEWNTLLTNWRRGAKDPSANGSHGINVSFAAMEPFFAMVRARRRRAARADEQPLPARRASHGPGRSPTNRLPAPCSCARFRAHLGTLLGSDGVLVMPTMPDIAPLRNSDGEALEKYRASAFHMLCLDGLAGSRRSRCPSLRARARRWACRSWILGPAGSDLSLVRLVERLERIERLERVERVERVEQPA